MEERRAQERGTRGSVPPKGGVPGFHSVICETARVAKVVNWG